MQNFCKCLLSYCLLLLLLQPTAARHAKLGSKDFQLEFLHELEVLTEQKAERSLNAFLDDVLYMQTYARHRQDITRARGDFKLQPKVVLIKQLLDEQGASSIQEDLEDTYVLRNLIFLRKLKQELQRLQECSAQEIRQLRLHRLCRQFQAELQPNETAHRRRQHAAPMPSLINEQNIGAALLQLDANASATTTPMNLTHFGRTLYANVKATGAEIIDNYLHILRELLQEVIAEKPEELSHSDSLTKVLNEIDAMLAIDDFYEKRQRLYTYLERNLAMDYEQLHSTKLAEQDLSELFTKVKSRGLDLFVLFLFSNFEFLEHVHNEWLKLLPQTPTALYDEQTRVLHDIQRHYDDFKRDTENAGKYDAYVGKLKSLHEQSQSAAGNGEHGHIFELMSNAAQNVGSVTFNMIKAKCKEL